MKRYKAKDVFEHTFDKDRCMQFCQKLAKNPNTLKGDD